jgi:hypothetical protein
VGEEAMRQEFLRADNSPRLAQRVGPRGQTWALYGFTTTYQYTHDARFLAERDVAEYFFLSALDKTLSKSS